MTTLTAHESERLEVLRRVLAHGSFCQKIVALHDYDRCLYVNWSRPPCTSDVVAVAHAWQAFGESSVNHYVNGVPLILDRYDSEPPFEREA